jgi:hypothetical protein
MHNLWVFISCVWALGAFSGCAALGAEAEVDAASYAKALFWPLFLVLFVFKGLCKAIYNVFSDWS